MTNGPRVNGTSVRQKETKMPLESCLWNRFVLVENFFGLTTVVLNKKAKVTSGTFS